MNALSAIFADARRWLDEAEEYHAADLYVEAQDAAAQAEAACGEIVGEMEELQ